MQNDFKTFMSLTEPELVSEISRILDAENIAHKIHDSRKEFNPGLNSNESGKSIDIQLQPKDFKTAELLISDKLQFDPQSIDPDHFLFSFSEAELKDLIKNSDEWHPIDVRLAKHILQTKGVSITSDDILEMQKQRIQEKAKPEKSFVEGIVIGYILAFAGGFLGFFIGNHLMSHKKTLPDGSQVLNYVETDRKHGRVIFIISSLSLIAWILFFTFRK